MVSCKLFPKERKNYRRPVHKPQPIAEVIFDKYGQPFDAEAVLRQGIINYHKFCE